MSTIGDALKALRTVLLMQDDVRGLRDQVKAHGERMSRLAEAHADLRDRVSRLEGVIEGAVMTARQRRIEE